LKNRAGWEVIANSNGLDEREGSWQEKVSKVAIRGRVTPGNIRKTAVRFEKRQRKILPVPSERKGGKFEI